MTDADYWAELPEGERAKIRRTVHQYSPLLPGAKPLDANEEPSYDQLCQLLAWQRLATEVVEAHGNWLQKVKTAIERTGREYTRENFLRYCRLRECE